MRVRRLIAVGCLMSAAGTLAARAGDHLLILAPDVPIVVRIDVEFEPGVTLEGNRRQYADRWFTRLDRDRSGTLDADEAARVPSFGRFEDIPGELQQEWTRLDTAPADGQLAAAELLAHIHAAMGSPLNIKRPRRSATQTVILHPRLDRDGDGQVAIEEVLSGVKSLTPFDFDDDQSLSAAELQPFPRSMRVAQTINAGQTPFVALDERVDLADITRRLIAQYGRSGAESEPTGLTCEAVGIDAERFAALDLDADKLLSADELQSYLSDPEPQLLIRLQFPRGRRVKRIEAVVIGVPEAVAIREESSRKQLVSELGGLNVDADLKDASESFSSITQTFRGTQFSIADRDRDGALNVEEFGRLEIDNITFTAVDADRDDRVSRAEFDDFVDLRALLAQCRLEMTVANETTSLFNELDGDKDFRLSPREFEQGGGPLTALDRNGNGKLAESELVTKYSLSFAITQPPEFDDLVGTAGFNAMADETQLPIVRPVTRGPQWFRRMDRNQDGDVIWREFLGPRDAFDRFDADSNGFIDSDEAEVAPPE
jgi:Ca2+-binding EF-hand superfamily protein